MSKDKKPMKTAKKRILLQMPEYVYEDMKRAADKRILTVTAYIIESIARRLHQETYNIEE